MSGTDEPKREPHEADPDALARELELELILQRSAWQQTRQRGRRWRALSFLFLLVIVIGALLAWLFLAPQVREHREETKAAETNR